MSTIPKPLEALPPKQPYQHGTQFMILSSAFQIRYKSLTLCKSSSTPARQLPPRLRRFIMLFWQLKLHDLRGAAVECIDSHCLLQLDKGKGPQLVCQGCSVHQTNMTQPKPFSTDVVSSTHPEAASGQSGLPRKLNIERLLSNPRTFFWNLVILTVR